MSAVCISLGIESLHLRALVAREPACEQRVGNRWKAPGFRPARASELPPGPGGPGPYPEATGSLVVPNQCADPVPGPCNVHPVRLTLCMSRH